MREGHSPLTLVHSDDGCGVESNDGGRRNDSDGDDSDWTGNAVRIRCDDAESLTATLQWYACSKFTKEDRKYIETYEWDERNGDFDPRIFQAFVWADDGRYCEI